jgi:hypothetical protein
MNIKFFLVILIPILVALDAFAGKASLHFLEWTEDILV